MKIGIEGGEDLRFHLEKDEDGDVSVVDSDGDKVVTFKVSGEGKIYLTTEDGIGEEHYSINKKKGHTDIEVIS